MIQKGWRTLPRSRAITGPLTRDIERLTETLFQQIPCGRLVFIQVGSPSGALAGECEAARDQSWFSVLGRRLRVAFHADNIWAYQTGQYLLERTSSPLTYVQVPKLLPFLTIPNGPDMEDAVIKEAIENLVTVTEGLEAAELLAELPMLVVTQLHMKEGAPPSLPLAIANALDLDEPHLALLEEVRLGPCHAVEITPDRIILHV
ncbi:MAG: hypothetical protein AAB416_02480 [Patescibacteria group bacterium]